MNRVFKIVKNHKRTIQFLSVIVFVFLSNTTILAQETSFKNSLESTLIIDQKGNAVDAAPVRVISSGNSNMNFILWFMGTKEDVNATISSDSFYSKKSILTSGREPNHLLMKTLLKRAINIKNC